MTASTRKAAPQATLALTSPVVWAASSWSGPHWLSSRPAAVAASGLNDHLSMMGMFRRLNWDLVT